MHCVEFALGLLVLAAHDMHLLFPVSFWYVPGMHGRHDTLLSFRTCVPCWAGSTLCLIVAYDASRTSNLTLCTCFFSFEMLMFSWRAWKTIRCASLLIHRLRSFEYSFFFFLDEHIHNCSSPKTIHRKDYSSTILQQFTFFLAHTQRASIISQKQKQKHKSWKVEKNLSY